VANKLIKISVWCAGSYQYVIGPIFFIDTLNDGHYQQSSSQFISCLEVE